MNNQTCTSNRSFQNTIHQYTMKRQKWKSQLFGQKLGRKEGGICRIVSHNINCLGLHTNSRYKSDILKEWLLQINADVCGLQETRIAQHMLKRHEKIAERMRDHRRDNIRMSSVNNQHESVEKLQFGGTAVFAYDYISYLVRLSGADETGLGRWCWLQLEGHRKKRVRIVSAYNPCRPPVHHYSTVYAQHKRYFNEMKQNVCPRRQFCRDLSQFIQQCQDEGENIILLIACNENLNQSHALQNMLTQEPHFLIDPIQYKYDHGQRLPPTTDKVSYPIDAIFVSPALLKIEAGGWLQINSGISDHRQLYIDISIKLLLGKYKNSTKPYTMRRLKCGNDKSVQKYNDILTTQYDHHNIFQKLQAFRANLSSPLSDSAKEQLFKIDRVCTSAVIHAEKRCRHIFAGGKPYTPDLNRLGRKIDAWRMIVKKKLGKNISSRTIKRAALAHDIPHIRDLILQECLNSRAEAYAEYKKYAKDAKLHRPQFLDKLADDREAEGNVVEAKKITRTKIQEETRIIHRNVKIATNGTQS